MTISIQYNQYVHLVSERLRETPFNPTFWRKLNSFESNWIYHVRNTQTQISWCLKGTLLATNVYLLLRKDFFRTSYVHCSTQSLLSCYFFLFLFFFLLFFFNHIFCLFSNHTSKVKFVIHTVVVVIFSWSFILF